MLPICSPSNTAFSGLKLTPRRDPTYHTNTFTRRGWNGMFSGALQLKRSLTTSMSCCHMLGEPLAIVLMSLFTRLK